jgi:hypothetical protein
VPPFTLLESDILDALAWDLRDVAPDLAGQFADSLPGARRNTGSGLFTELIVDRDRPPPLTEPTGRFGTVHAMVSDLPDPIAFQVELRHGRLLALHGDAYGQDTRAIDFARVPFDQVFTVDDQGDSIAFDPARLMQPVPLHDLRRNPGHPGPPPDDAPVARNTAADDLVGIIFGASGAGTVVRARDADDSPPAKSDETSVLIAAWAAIAALTVLLVVIVRVPWMFALIIAFTIGRVVQKPTVLSALARATRRLGQFEYRPPEQ